MNTGINENKVRRLAYSIWEAEGKPLGQEERHWRMALEQAEADEEQYLVGENFLGDSINPADQAAVLSDDREYATLTETELDTIEAEAMNTPQQPMDTRFTNKTEKRRKSGADASADGQTQVKKKSGNKKKSSDNILV